MSRFLNLRRRSFVVLHVQMEGGLFVNVNLDNCKKGGNVVRRARKGMPLK